MVAVTTRCKWCDEQTFDSDNQCYDCKQLLSHIERALDIAKQMIITIEDQIREKLNKPSAANALRPSFFDPKVYGEDIPAKEK